MVNLITSSGYQPFPDDITEEKIKPSSPLQGRLAEGPAPDVHASRASRFQFAKFLTVGAYFLSYAAVTGVSFFSNALEGRSEVIGGLMSSEGLLAIPLFFLLRKIIQIVEKERVLAACDRTALDTTEVTEYTDDDSYEIRSISKTINELETYLNENTQSAALKPIFVRLIGISEQFRLWNQEAHVAVNKFKRKQVEELISKMKIAKNEFNDIIAEIEIYKSQQPAKNRDVELTALHESNT